MVAFNEQYVTDKNGKPIGVFLDLEDFQRIAEELEELDAIRAYDAAKSSGETPIPFQQAVQQIEQARP